ncbi:MAG: molybdopterin-dependent oxidoreductase [Gammaproteobacteria bacterium]|nr:molybdopterin-dependent oxidoreductase [Gammaproteobacteria bacterium]
MKKKGLNFTVNGRAETIDVTPRTRLLDALRVDLGLIGTKEGCGTGDCGSCTVLLDGNAVNSCMVLALQAEGREITTIEGLGKPGALDPVQQAMVQCGGIQCGFCTPGMVLSLKDLFNRNPEPDEEEVRVAISSNLCRCTGYTKIFDAARALRDRTLDTQAANGNDDAIGARMVRTDAVEKVTGSAVYAEDVRLPRMVYGALVRSPFPHATILSIDTSAAVNHPAVRAVVTGRDIEMGYYGYELQDQRVFALEKVRYLGEPVAAVAADTPDAAREAAALVKVDYQELPAVFDPEEAMSEDAPLVHEDQNAYQLDWESERKGNLCYRLEFGDGDVEQGFAEADQVVEGTYHTPEAHAGAIEPHSATAMTEPTGRITVWTTTQKPFAVRSYLAKALKRPISTFKVVPTHIGGGFGGKLFPVVEPYVVLLAERAGLPVQMTLSRDEEMAGAMLLRHPSKVRIKTGVMKDGSLVAHQVRMLFNTGAYGPYGPNTAALGSLMAGGPYRIPNLEITGLVTYTNNVPKGSIRCPSGPQMAFAVETHMDKVARAVGMDGLSFRLKNAWEDGDATCTGQPLAAVSLKECLQKAADAVEWDKPCPPGSGKGLACNWWVSGTWGTQTLIETNEDATFRLISGCVDMGTGGLTSSVLQMAAEGLGVPVDSIQLVRGDTDTLPWDHGHGGSRMTFTIARSAYEAALDLKRQLLNEAADRLEAAPDDMALKDGRVFVRGDPSNAIGLAEICYNRHKKHGGPMIGVSSLLDDQPPTTKEHPIGGFPAPSFCAHAVELAVDETTGEIDLKRYAAVHDVGKAVNPTGCEGQIEGGVAMGLGLAMMEELREVDGKVLNPSFADYLLISAEDMPPTQTILVEQPAVDGIMGIKGVGEPPIAPPTGAIANALADALDVDVSRLPLTPEQVSALIAERKT